ncbi:unnamed protein product [Clonostachys rosea]|uniref:VWFA domain-containing protein n=1 Tax=Bionectria ochroleuca TaxID=29856 RepID=A0ABY6TUS8_BIOOC|nr:unnamed protein product [Clonostachys rosea]
MSIFGPTISWDPREPLPHDLQRQKWKLAVGKHNTNLRPNHHAGSIKDGITGNVLSHVRSYVQTLPEKLAGNNEKLPDLTIEEEARNLLAPWSIEIDASIVQDTASVQVTQVFWNNSTMLIPKGTYTFPLPTGCSVTEFTCQIGSKFLKGTVKPKKEAQNAFNDHVAAGRIAGLLEQDTTEIFSATLGNIPPETRVTVKISYITLLKHHLVSGKENMEISTFTIPTCIASRYGPQPRFAATATADVKQGLTLNINILDSRTIHIIRSLTHNIKVEDRAGDRAASSWADLADEESGKILSGQASLVQLDQGSLFLDKDFCLEVVVDVGKGPAAPEAWVEHHPTDPNQAALMAILPPGLLNQIPKTQPRPREILFLVDQSGSMEDKIESLKSAMHFFLKGIPLGSKFNIARFGSTFTSWCPQSVQYSGESLEAALAYASSSIDANMGGTEILDAVESILGSRDTGMWTDIIILTDGQVWRLDQLLATVKDARKSSGNRIRFFCLGIGEQVSHALVEGIASMGGGYAEVVPASEQHSWEHKLVSMEAASLENDPIGEVKAYLETSQGKAIHCPSSAMSPAVLQILNPFVRNRIYMLFDSEMTKDFRNLAPLMDDQEQTFVRNLLGRQHFDGSFECATDEEFALLLGQDTLDAVASLVDHTLSRPLYFTIAVIVVLEQHFASRKQLWHMMHSKASAYIKDATKQNTSFDMEAFRAGLQVVKSPLDQAGLQLESKNRKPGWRMMSSNILGSAKQTRTRIASFSMKISHSKSRKMKIPPGQVNRDLENLGHRQGASSGADGLENPQKSEPVTRQARRVIDIAPSD